MKIYRTKIGKIAGTDFHEVKKKAFLIYQDIKRKSKRKPYVRSAYFNNEKIFLDLFWTHLFMKQNQRDRLRRTKYFAAAIDLIINSRFQPESKENPNRKSEILHRFTGITSNANLFHVQIKENKNNQHKWFLSVFPDEK